MSVYVFIPDCPTIDARTNSDRCLFPWGMLQVARFWNALFTDEEQSSKSQASPFFVHILFFHIISPISEANFIYVSRLCVWGWFASASRWTSLAKILERQPSQTHARNQASYRQQGKACHAFWRFANNDNELKMNNLCYRHLSNFLICKPI